MPAGLHRYESGFSSKQPKKHTQISAELTMYVKVQADLLTKSNLKEFYASNCGLICVDIPYCEQNIEFFK